MQACLGVSGSGRLAVASGSRRSQARQQQQQLLGSRCPLAPPLRPLACSRQPCAAFARSARGRAVAARQPDAEEFGEDEGELEEGEEEVEQRQQSGLPPPQTDRASGSDAATQLIAAAQQAASQQPDMLSDEELAELEGEPPFPEPQERGLLLADLLGLAGEAEAAALLQDSFPDVLVTGISDNPNSVLPGDVYVCMEHVHPTAGLFDGHSAEAVEAALEAGAVAILAEAELPEGLVPPDVAVLYADDSEELAGRLAAMLYDVPGTGLNLVAVTGSSGKTTVAWLVRGVLEQAGQLTGMVGSIEHALAEHLLTLEGDLWSPADEDPAAGRECASPFHLVPYKGRYCVEETTPSGLHMQKLLAGMRDRGASAAVVECAPSALATGSLEFVQPSIAVHTNLLDHPGDLELFGSQQECLDAQLELFRSLSDPAKQRAVLNADDEAYAALKAACGDVPTISYGIDNPAAEVRLDSLSELSLWQTTMIIATPVGRLEIITNLIGRHNIANVLAAVAVGVLCDVPLADIGAGIESVQVVPGRCEVVNNLLDPPPAPEGEGEAAPEAPAKLPADFAVVVDAADTPQRLATVLQGLREAGAARVFTVIGCDGQVTSGETRARMGEVAHQRSEFVIVTNSSPGMEEPSDIVQDIVSGWPNELFEPYAAYVYSVFQDQTHAPLWFEPFLHSAQRRWQRHIMEDRFQAIRAAIGTAAPGDVVLLAGRGHRDYVEHSDGESGVVRGWFDDRVEARNALSKLQYLYALVALDRSKLPWGPAPDEGKTVVVELE